MRFSFPCVKTNYARVGHSDTPLFPGYMFIRFDLVKDGWVKFQGEVPTVPKEIVHALALKLDEKSGGQGLWRRFQPGDLVKVVAGALRGRGEVVEVAKTPNGRAKIMLEFMGQTVEAKVPWEVLQSTEENSGKPRLPRRTRGMGRRIRDFRPSIS